MGTAASCAASDVPDPMLVAEPMNGAGDAIVATLVTSLMLMKVESLMFEHNPRPTIKP